MKDHSVWPESRRYDVIDLAVVVLPVGAIRDKPLARERSIVGLAISICPPRPRGEGEEDRTEDPLDHGIALPKTLGCHTSRSKKLEELPAFRCCPLRR
jgi:hypothetical protein